MRCEMCGSEGQLFKAIIEETHLQVCKSCSGHGNVLERVRPVEKVRSRVEREMVEEVEVIISDFDKVMCSQRNSSGLSQEEFAHKISEKASLVQRMESGDFTPSLEKVRKLEKILGLKLIETYKEEKIENVVSESQGFTIADMIKIKKK